MLSLLHIENIAVIESADISFDRGFNVLTGETGAGKSIVIDAISAILGERAYRDMIRTGAAKASVRAVFTDVPEYPWFSENGVEYDPETVIQREIYLDGKNICRVNGSLVSVSILRKLGIQLINIHGQHDSASLFDEENHLAFLDAFADNRSLRESYSQAYQKVSELRREIDSLTMDESEKLRRMETLKYQIGEIEKAQLEPGEDEALEQRRKLLQNADLRFGIVDGGIADHHHPRHIVEFRKLAQLDLRNVGTVVGDQAHEGVIALFPRADFHHIFHIIDKNFAIPDMAGIKDFLRRIDHAADRHLADNDIDLHLGQKIRFYRSAAIVLRLALLCAVAQDMGYSHAGNANRGHG